MKKSDLKKLALMGITGGIMLSSQGAQGAATEDFGADRLENLLAAKCGSKCGSLSHSCGGSENPEGNRLTADRGCGAGKCGGAHQHSCGGQPSEDNGGQSSCNSRQGKGDNWNRLTADRGCGASCGSGHHKTSLTADAAADHKVARTQDHKELTETELLSQLNAEGKALYNQLTPEGKKLALKLANQSCKGHNECKGTNSCKGKDHDCAGKGGCKGTSQGPFKDKNHAVKVAAQKMAEKRASLNKSNKSSQFVSQLEGNKPNNGNTGPLQDDVDTLERHSKQKRDAFQQNSNSYNNPNTNPNTNPYNNPNTNTNANPYNNSNTNPNPNPSNLRNPVNNGR